MTKQILSFSLMAVMLLAGWIAPLQAVEPLAQYTLRFSGKNKTDNSAVTLKQVTLSNLTQGCDTTFTATTFVLKVLPALSIETVSLAESMQVRLSSANPFIAAAEVEVTLPSITTLRLTLFGVDGKIQQSFGGTFEPGVHRFSVEPSNAGISFLSISSGKSQQTLKLIKLSGGGSAQIAYASANRAGNNQLLTQKIPLRAPAARLFAYHEGDQLQLIGHADGFDNSSLFDVPVGDKDYTFLFDASIGADFGAGKVKVYNFSGEFKWEGYEYGPTAARFATMNLEHVIISGREAMPGKQPYIFELNDLKVGNINNPTVMNRDGVWGGNSGAELTGVHLVHGQAYSCNMQADLGTARLRIYHWPNIFGPPKTSSPGFDGAKCLREYLVPKGPEWPIPGVDNSMDGMGNLRLGDSMSVDLDESGNGYLFLMGRRMLCVGRIPVTNFTQLGELKLDILPGFQSSTEFGEPRTPLGYHSYKRVDGADNEYLYSAGYEPIRLVDRDGNKLYTMTSFKRDEDGCAAHIINFNGARYLVTMNDVQWFGEAVIAIYDVTKGATTKEALENFDKSSNKAPKFTFSLNGMLADDWGLAVSIDFAKDSDKLYIIGSAAEAGFAIIELPAKK